MALAGSLRLRTLDSLMGIRPRKRQKARRGRRRKKEERD